MVMRGACPRCGSRHHKKNGHIHNGKQNHRCKACGRQFVREFAQRLSLGRVPGVGRATAQGTALLARHLPCGRREHDVADGVSESSATRRRPRTLTYTPRSAANHSGSLPWRLKRTNSAALSAKRPINSGCGWPWTPGAAKSLLSMSGKSSRHSARQLWDKLPAIYRQHATFYTDAYAPYGRVIPRARHRTIPQSCAEDQSCGAVQRDFTAATLALGAVGVIVFKTLGPSHRRHLSLHLRL
jgi:insertion element IS1 protein InsB